MIQPCGLGCLARMGIRTFQFKTCLSAFSPRREVKPEGASGLVTRSSIWEPYLRLVCWTRKQRVRRTPPVPDLNELFSLGGKPRRALRTRLSQLLSSDSSDISKVERCLVQTAECELHLPSRIGDYTDFYVGIHHATNIGKQFRPDNPLLPNYKYVPIGYHGRASSVCPSGVPVRRPTGQFKPSAEAPPVVGPAQRLDYELELGIWIGSGNALGDRSPSKMLLTISLATAC